MNAIRNIKVLLLSTSLAVGMLVTLPTVASSSQNGVCSTGVFASGNGSELSPYVVEDQTDLEEVADCGASFSYHYSQSQDIVLAGQWTNQNDFSGNYEGNNHSISNLNIDGVSGANGLFGEISSSEISNLTISGSITNVNPYTGLLAGSIQSTSITHLTVNVDISAPESFLEGTLTEIGGVTGYTTNNVSLTNVVVNPLTEDSKIQGEGWVGGAIGLARDTDLVSVFSTVDLELVEDADTQSSFGEGYFGGLVGEAGFSGLNGTSFSIAGSAANSQVNCGNEGNYCGGLVGSTTYQIQDSYSLGNVSGSNYIGGIAGYTSNNIEFSYASGDVEANVGHAGGVVGEMYLDHTTISFSKVFSKGSVTGGFAVGGLVGKVTFDGSDFYITNSNSLSNISATSLTAGGLIGDVSDYGENGVFISNAYFGGEYGDTGIYGGVLGRDLYNNINWELSEVYWTKKTGVNSYNLAPESNALPKTFFGRYTTFDDPSWDLVDTWKLDLSADGGLLSLRGLATPFEVFSATPNCLKVNLTSITFKKNSAKILHSKKDILRQNSLKIINSYCSTIKVFGYASKDEPKKKQKTLARQRAMAVANFVRGQLEQNWIYLKVIPVGKGVLSKGKVAANRKVTATITN